MTRTMYDSTAAADYPSGGDVVLAYVDGQYANGPALALRFPGTPQMSCAVYASTQGAQCYDIEPSCIWPPDAAVPAILRRERAAGRWPTLYVGGRANWHLVIAAVDAAGLEHPPYIVAHYTNKPHLCSSDCYSTSVGDHVAHGTQYGGDLKGHYDVSVLVDYIPGFDRTGLQPAGGGIIYTGAPGAPTEEDDMAQVSQEAFDKLVKDVAETKAAVSEIQGWWDSDGPLRGLLNTDVQQGTDVRGGIEGLPALLAADNDALAARVAGKLGNGVTADQVKAAFDAAKSELSK